MVYTEYGPPEVLRLEDVEKPQPKENEVLVKLSATSLNASDWEILTGKPLYARIYGLFKPKYKILGTDIAGRVEAIGEKVSKFKVGDEVFGDIFDYFGGLAEYVSVPATNLTHKPACLTFVQAAAIPQAAVIAMQGLRDIKPLQPGQDVLINGAGGGAGSFAIQIAKSNNTVVTAVDNQEKLEVMRSLGADHVINYRQEDFTKNGQRYDLILDLAAHHSIFKYRRSLKPDGIYIMVGGSMKRVLQLLVLMPWLLIAGRKKMVFLALKINKGLNEILALVESGKLSPCIDKCYPFSETREALRYLGDGHAKGKVVVSMEEMERD